MTDYQYITDSLYKIYDYYSDDNQKMKLIEEMAELTQAILKYRQCCGVEEYANYIEELADVSILLEQLIINIPCQDYFEDVREGKIRRTLERIKNE